VYPCGVLAESGLIISVLPSSGVDRGLEITTYRRTFNSKIFA
jgi:hypothetical protein